MNKFLSGTAFFALRICTTLASLTIDSSNVVFCSGKVMCSNDKNWQLVVTLYGSETSAGVGTATGSISSGYDWSDAYGHWELNYDLNVQATWNTTYWYFELEQLNVFRGLEEGRYHDNWTHEIPHSVYCASNDKTHVLKQGVSDWYRYGITATAKWNMGLRISDSNTYDTSFFLQDTDYDISSSDTEVQAAFTLDKTLCYNNISEDYYAVSAEYIYTTPEYINKNLWADGVSPNRLLMTNETFVANFECGKYEGYYTLIPHYETEDDYYLNGLDYALMKDDQMQYWKFYADDTWSQVMDLVSCDQVAAVESDTTHGLTHTGIADSITITLDLDHTYWLTNIATPSPTDAPTSHPTNAPSNSPSDAPTRSPTDAPSNSPTTAPTWHPSTAPLHAPSHSPTTAPSDAPSSAPSNAPSRSPTIAPSTAPSNAPSNTPTRSPSIAPTSAPSDAPTNIPTNAPTRSPTGAPTTIYRSYDAYATRGELEVSGLELSDLNTDNREGIQISIATALSVGQEFVRLDGASNLNLTSRRLRSRRLDIQVIVIDFTVFSLDESDQARIVDALDETSTYHTLLSTIIEYVPSVSGIYIIYKEATCGVGEEPYDVGADYICQSICNYTEYYDTSSKTCKLQHIYKLADAEVPVHTDTVLRGVLFGIGLFVLWPLTLVGIYYGRKFFQTYSLNIGMGKSSKKQTAVSIHDIGLESDDFETAERIKSSKNQKSAKKVPSSTRSMPAVRPKRSPKKEKYSKTPKSGRLIRIREKAAELSAKKREYDTRNKLRSQSIPIEQSDEEGSDPSESMSSGTSSSSSDQIGENSGTLSEQSSNSSNSHSQNSSSSGVVPATYSRPKYGKKKSVFNDSSDSTSTGSSN